MLTVDQLTFQHFIPLATKVPAGMVIRPLTSHGRERGAAEHRTCAVRPPERTVCSKNELTNSPLSDLPNRRTVLSFECSDLIDLCMRVYRDLQGGSCGPEWPIEQRLATAPAAGGRPSGPLRPFGDPRSPTLRVG